MSVLFSSFSYEPGSRMTGIFTTGGRLDTETDLLVWATKVQLGANQDGSVEADFLQAHLPFCFGGFHGVGPDGDPWTVMLQVAPAPAARLVNAIDPYWPMADGLDRALAWNLEAAIEEAYGWDRSALVAAYEHQGVDPVAVAEWSVPDLMQGLLAECCNVALDQVVAGRLTQCAFPDLDHDCEHDVFRDVFAMWTTGRLNPPEQ